MLHFIQVHRPLSVKGVQIHSVETTAWRVSVHFITHYQIVWLFFLVLCAISPHQGSTESRKMRPKSPRNQWTPFIQLTFSSFECFNVFFFTERVVHHLNISDQRLQNGRFIFLKNRFFKVVAGDSPASKLSYLGGRSEPRSREVPVPRTPLSRLLARLLFTIGGGCGLWARNIAHRTCRKLCVLPTLKQNSVRA